MNFAETFESRYDLLLSDAELTAILSDSRTTNAHENIERFGLLVEDTVSFDSAKTESIRAIIKHQPTLLSVSGQDTLLPYLELLQSSKAVISEFLCWKYVSSFTPLDFTPPENWDEVMELFVDSETKQLLLSGYANELYQLRELVDEPSVEALIAFETALALHFRPRIPKRGPFYFSDFAPIRPGDTVLDCGACSNDFGGQFVTEFARACSPDGKVIAFEPMSEVFRALKKDTADVFNVALINAAVWSRPMMLTFVSDGIQSRRLQNAELESDSQDELSHPGTQVHVRAETIDAAAAEQSVEFIKMDVEGSELEALHGASETIQRDKPNLSICLYHSPEDFIEIPKLIKTLCPEYQMSLELNEGHCWAGMKLFATAR